ncbi:MAG: Gfo/Idh/MocA family protein [Armatimonadota bacterium]
MANDVLRTAVIGVGLFGENHARAYADYHRSQLVCVCDVRADRAREVAAQFGCDYTEDYRQVTESGEIDAVSIATPDFAHLEPCLAALSAGKHVLVEKPLATSTDEAVRIVEAARSSGVKLMVDFHNRWNPPFVAAKEAIDAGRIGEPVMGYARLANPLSVPLRMLSWSSQSGPEWFLLPHILDLMRWLLGREATRVFAVGRRGILESKGIQVWDAIQAVVEFGSAFVTFETAWILPDSLPSVIDFKVNVVGETGKLSAVLDEAGLEIASDSFTYPFFSASRLSHGRNEGFIYEPIRHFVDCVLDDQNPAVTGEDGLAATAIVEAVLTSLVTGQPASVEPL